MQTGDRNREKGRNHILQVQFEMHMGRRKELTKFYIAIELN